MTMIRYLTVQQTCDKIHRSRWTVYRLIAAGMLAAEKKGHHVFVDANSVEAYIRNYRVTMAAS